MVQISLTGLLEQQVQSFALQTGQDVETLVANAMHAYLANPTLVPAKSPVRLGALKGQGWVADDFDAPLPTDMLEAVYKDGLL